MPGGSQNIENWSVDQFRSVVFPTTTPVEEYRKHLFKFNLGIYTPSGDLIEGTPPPFEEFTVNTTTGLVDPGNMEFYLAEGNVAQEIRELRNTLFLGGNSTFDKNIYGPKEWQLVDTNTLGGYCDEFGNELTSFKQYPVGYGTDIRSSIIAQQAGFGNAAGIEFKVPQKDGSVDDSQLDKIGKERRKEEFFARVKNNALSETLGKINLDPFGLLSGQDLIQKDYSITRPKTAAGQILDFVGGNIVGFELPTSIIPDNIFPDYGSQGSKNLLDYTGQGQRQVLYTNMSVNKYGPNFQQEGASEDTDSAPQKSGYLSESNRSEVNDESLADKINDKFQGTIDALFNQYSSSQNLTPEEFDKPSPSKDHTQYGVLGFSYFERNADTIEALRNNRYTTFDQVTYSDAFKTVVTDYDSSKIDRDLGKMSDNLYWDSDTKMTPPKKGLLKYTQKIMQSKEGGARFIGQPNSDTNMTTQYNGKHKTFSQGNLVKEGTGKEEDGYCRSWSIRRGYTSYGDLIRGSKLIAPANARVNQTVREGSVLKDPGVVKIAWESDGDYEAGILGKIMSQNKAHKFASQYMLSLENLAWVGAPQFFKLPKCEVGPNGGRIMWFPPYDISFNETSSAQYDSTNFIGRAEPIYTYNSSERTGNLSFKIITDHSSVMNLFDTDAFKKTESEIDRFIWGCSDIDDTLLDRFLSKEEKTEISKTETIEETKPEYVEKDPTPPQKVAKIYFPNARSDCKESPKCPGREVDEDWEYCETIVTGVTEDTISFCLNYDAFSGGVSDDGLWSIDYLAEFLTGKNSLGEDSGDDSGKYYKIRVIGNTSGNATKEYNEKLGLDRARNVKEYLYNKMVTLEGDQPTEYKVDGFDDVVRHKSEKDSFNDVICKSPLCKSNEKNGTPENVRWELVTRGESNSVGPQDEDNSFDESTILVYGARISRNVEIELVVNRARVANYIKDKLKQIQPNKNKIETIREVSKRISKRIYSECDVFEKIKEDQPFIYNSFKEKIKNFHPAFHSMTPEMFNNRLNFLLQCTRQGPTLNDKEVPQNLAFGKPPICILRVGDFYHTKIVIDSVGISYDPLVWDLNPEGIGVQPMLADIDISFKFIGGSSLGGPIRQLQNAVSYNFFANTSLYRPLEKFQLNNENPNEATGLGNLGKEYYYGAFGSPEQEEDLNVENFVVDEEIVEEKDPIVVVTPIEDDDKEEKEEETNKDDEDKNDTLKLDLKDIEIIGVDSTTYTFDITYVCSKVPKTITLTLGDSSGKGTKSVYKHLEQRPSSISKIIKASESINDGYRVKITNDGPEPNRRFFTAEIEDSDGQKAKKEFVIDTRQKGCYIRLVNSEGDELKNSCKGCSSDQDMKSKGLCLQVVNEVELPLNTVLGGDNTGGARNTGFNQRIEVLKNTELINNEVGKFEI